MPRTQLFNAKKASEHFAHVNEYLRNEFVIYGEPDGPGVYLLVPGRVVGLTGTGVEDLAKPELAETIHYTKTKIQTTPLVGSDQHAELAIVNRDGIFNTLVWTTTPENIRAALRSGVFDYQPMQNPVAKMIAQLGEYKRNVFSLSIEDNMIVKHNYEKLTIVDITQKILEAIQPLHSCINNYDESISPIDNLSALITRLNSLIDKISVLKKNHQSYLDFDVDVVNHQNELISKIAAYRDHLMKLMREKLHNFTEADMTSILQISPNSLWKSNVSLQLFLQDFLNHSIKNAIEMNYSVSGLFQDTSGLQKILTDTSFMAESFSSARIDYCNSFTPQHAFDFSERVNSKGLVTLDFSLYGFVPATKLDLAKKVALIQTIDAGKQLYRKSDREPGFLSIKWYDVLRAPLTLMRWFVNGFKDIVGTLADLIYVAGKAIDNIYLFIIGEKTESPDFPSGKKLLLKKESFENKYASLPANTKLFSPDHVTTTIPYRSLLQQLYSKTAEIVARYFVDPLYSISNLVVDELWQFKTLRRIIYDSTIGTKPVDDMAIALLLEQRIYETRANEISNGITQASLIADFNSLQSTEINSYADLENSLNTNKDELPKSAVIPYRLTPDEPSDALNWAIDDFARSLVEVFTHEMYRGHPVAGLTFTSVGLTAAPLVFPALMSNVVLGSINKYFTMRLAEALIGELGGLTTALSTAVLQGQIAYFLVDMLNGRNSSIRYGAKTVIENPILAILVAGSAVSFGYAIAHELSIPWLSNMIAEETGHAAFPWFGLGTAGAKIAAILVESTMNLHKEQDEDSIDLYIDNAIDKMHGEIEAALLQQHIEHQGIAESDLSVEDVKYIKLQANIYCDNIKKALRKTEFAAQVTQLSNTIDTMFLEHIAGSSGRRTPSNSKDVRQLASFIDKREKRQQIAALNPKNLSEKDKYMIIHYLNQTYPDQPEYVDSVRDHLMQERKMGPLAETFKILLAYPSSLIRAAFAVVRTITYLLLTVFNLVLKDKERLVELQMIVRSVSIPVKDLFRKIKNDIGLVVKGLAGFLRIGWGVLAGILFMPLTVLLLIPTTVVEGKFSVKVFSSVNKLLFAPGRVSAFINMVVGLMRSDAGSKDLRIITRDMDIHYNRKILNPATIRAELANSKEQVTAPADMEPEQLNVLILDIMKETFQKHPTLRAYTMPRFATFQELNDAVNHGIANSFHYTNTSRFFEPDPAFKRELNAALLQVIAKIKNHSEICFKDSMPYQKSLMELIQANKRNPILICKKSYEEFTSFVLPASRPKNADLHAFYDKLIAAQSALLKLRTTSSDTKARSVAVIELLDKHDCLSLQSVREISRLKKTILFMKKFEKNNGVANKDSSIPAANKLLRAFELIHTSARTASHRLAVDVGIITALTRLHVHTGPAATSTLSSTAVDFQAAPGNVPELSYRPTLLLMGREDSSAPRFAKVRPVSAVTVAEQNGVELTDMSRTAALKRVV